MRLLFLIAAVWCASCERRSPEASYAPLNDVEAAYGRLITTANHPTPYQHGTGERIGVFEGSDGMIFGLPIAAAYDGSLVVCAPEALHSARVTAHYPTGWAIIGATNEPTGWRGGTGTLEIVLRDPSGTVHLQPVAGAELADGPVCRASSMPGPEQNLQYYRIAPQPTSPMASLRESSPTGSNGATVIENFNLVNLRTQDPAFALVSGGVALGR